MYQGSLTAKLHAIGRVAVYFNARYSTLTARMDGKTWQLPVSCHREARIHHRVQTMTFEQIKAFGEVRQQAA